MLLKLADTVLVLINTGQSNVKLLTSKIWKHQFQRKSHLLYCYSILQNGIKKQMTSEFFKKWGEFWLEWMSPTFLSRIHGWSIENLLLLSHFVSCWYFCCKNIVCNLNICDNYVLQWWVEIDDELSCLFTKRFRGFFLTYL